MNKPVLEVRSLSTHFFTEDGVIRAVENISFDLFPGEILSLVGESGCGKSVTALSILKLIAKPAGPDRQRRDPVRRERPSEIQRERDGEGEGK